MQQNKTQAKTHAHKQSSIKKQTGCCATQIILNCCETVFQNCPSIKETQYLKKKFNTETTLTHSCTNLCIMILKVYYQNKCSLKLSSLITIKLYMFLIPKTIYMLNSWNDNPAFILSSITSSWFRWTYKHINLYNHTKIRRTAWGNKNKCCQLKGHRC